MAIGRYNPFREIDELLGNLTRMGPGPEGPGPEGRALAEWTPRTDVSETATEYRIKVDLPGVDKDNVEVHVENNLLTLRGERNFESEEGDDEKHHRVERFYGRFERSFGLPDDVDAESISARHNDGVLEVVLPKTRQTESGKRRISVS